VPDTEAAPAEIAKSLVFAAIQMSDAEALQRTQDQAPSWAATYSLVAA
jgi:hypothetical protein